jgi:NAD(P)-dependent dehydrogenase (short-subunit alcohol dehydrogenase family)
VVVTGATGGVGRATARRFAETGADVALLARGEAGLEAAAKDVEAAGRRSLALAVDTAAPGEVDDAAARITAQLGPIDIWVNNAFTSVFAPFDQITPEEFRRVTEVTYLGYVNGTRAALDHMRPRHQGTIIQVGSALAYRGIPLQSAYCGAKHAIQGFTESLRAELDHDDAGIHITMVQLPAVNTPQFTWVLARLPRRPRPVPPIYQPELAARAIVWAADHRRREWWVGASTAATLIANTVAPGILDRYLARTGYDSQQTSEAAADNRPANLWRPSDDQDDQGAHGPFDDSAHDRSMQWTLTRRRRVLVAAGIAGAAAALAARRTAG